MLRRSLASASNSALCKPRVLVLAGPTGVGKTEVSIRVAEMVGGEIVSADSVQVYRGMDVGTAKASLQQRARVQHHLLDVSAISKQFTAGCFVEHASKAIEDIHARGKLPIVVGGTAFYLRSLVEGLPKTPPTDPTVETIVAAKIDGLNWPEAFSLLEARDPKYAAGVAVNDWYRLRRALAIMESSGRSVSSFVVNNSAFEGASYDWRCVFLTAPRLDIYSKIDERCETIVRDGLVEETAQLTKLGLEPWTAGARAVGYRQALDYINTDWLTHDTRSRQGRRRGLVRFLQTYQASTRNYARKQLSWYRNKEPRYWWLSRSEEDSTEDIAVRHFGWISERFSSCTWSPPGSTTVEDRAVFDKATVARLGMHRYRAVESIYEDRETADAKLEEIRNVLTAVYPKILGDVDEDTGDSITDRQGVSNKGGRRARRRAREDDLTAFKTAR